MSVVSVSRALGCLTAEASPSLGSRASRERHHDIDRKHRASRKKRRGRSPRQPLCRSPRVLAGGEALAERGGEEGRGPPEPTSAGRGSPRAGRGEQPRAAEGVHPVRGADRRRFRTSAKLTSSLGGEMGPRRMSSRQPRLGGELGPRRMSSRQPKARQPRSGYRSPRSEGGLRMRSARPAAGVCRAKRSWCTPREPGGRSPTPLAYTKDRGAISA